MKHKKLAVIIATALATITATVAFVGCGGRETEALYLAQNWQYMTNGNTDDSGGVPYSLDDGSIKFHNANQAYELGDISNGSVEFMLKGSKNWQLWFNAESRDNAADCYKLVHKDGDVYLSTQTNGAAEATAKAADTKYAANDWNKFAISFTTVDSVCTVKVKFNDQEVDFENTGISEAVKINDGDMVHTRPDGFDTGAYLCAKVWYGDCFLQLRSVADRDVAEVKKIACIGDSITYGANADNSYTESYPAQLQKLYGGKYNVMNFGKSGATVRDSADDPYRKTPEYAGVKLFKPDVSIVMLGSNDSKTYQVPNQYQMEEAFKALLDDLYEITADPIIYIATSPYAYSTAYQISNANIEQFVVPAQEAIAEEYLLTLVPMHEYTKDMSGNYADGIHPKTKGYTYIAYMFWCTLEGTEPDPAYVATFKD